MPRPVDSGQRYMPGLDGLRAIAVLAVIAYHEQFVWAPGGLLGVGVFFTLSGFLITAILVSQWSAIGKLNLGDFWLHRARRLLPALFVMLAVVTAWVTVADRARLASLRGSVGAATAYFSNWYIIAQNQSYFARFAPPAPLDHLWSLAVEEQFYLLWPLLLIGGLLLLRRRHAATAWLMLPTGIAAAGSAVAMTLLYQPGMDPTRVYEGTDTRAFGLLIGATLALAWPSGSTRGAHSAQRRWPGFALDAVGLGGLAGIGVMIWKVGEYSAFAYHGGLVLLSFATVAVVAATAYPASMVGAALGWRPLRWIGVRSYGIYLWHYPVIVMTTPAGAKPSLPTAGLQIAASILLAALSWQLIEEPIRHGVIGRAWTRLRAAGWRCTLGHANLPGVAATTGTVAVVVVAVAGLSGAVRDNAGTRVGSVLSQGSLQLPVTKTAVKAPKSNRVQNSGPAASQSPPATLPGTVPGGGPLRTSCRAVAHIGDSTSDGLVSPEYLPKPWERIAARYEDVGVRSVVTDISGARSVAEVLPGQINGYNAMRNITRGGFGGCWVIALGTNDTADVAAGSNIGLVTRIGRVMKAAHGEPVMWVNVKSLLSSGPYAETNMARWDQTLLKECAKYPNMRVYNWAAEVETKWYISDGIHFTSIGYKHRAKMIADALARAFPATGHPAGCLVSS
ncbi:MAG TPA: acyltransferase family protein [Streptosporangiaceae bacterium]|nr:acyltransferase family protein [Streptosporangiaceae bacterium]